MAKLQFTESASADAVLILTHEEARGLAKMAGEGAAARVAAGLARPNAATQRALEALGASFGMPPGVLADQGEATKYERAAAAYGAVFFASKEPGQIICAMPNGENESGATREEAARLICERHDLTR